MMVMMGMMVQEILLQLKEEFEKGKTEVMEELELKNRQTYNNWFAGVKPTHENAYKLNAFLERCKQEKRWIEERLPPTQSEVLVASYWPNFGDWFEQFDLPDGFAREVKRMSMQQYDANVEGKWLSNCRFPEYHAENSWIWKESDEWQYRIVAKWHPDEETRKKFQSII